MPILYSCRSAGPSAFVIAKFDEDMNVEAVYSLGTDARGYPTCDCPAGPRPTCRHRNMLRTFALAGAIDSDRFYCYETQEWHQPIETYATLDEAESAHAAKAADAAKGFVEAWDASPMGKEANAARANAAKDLTLDEFVDRHGTPLLKQHMAEIKSGPVTPERIRSMADEHFPDLPPRTKLRRI